VSAELARVAEPTGSTVTVTHHEARFTLSFSRLPGRTSGPFDFAEAVRDLTVSALLVPVDARNLVMDASTDGVAVSHTGDATSETDAHRPAA
jgi:hypothetical protein